MRTAVVSALGVTILLGTPLLAQADQGKWWKPKEGDRKVERRGRGHADRGQEERGTWRDDRSSGGRVYGDRSGIWRGRSSGDTRTRGDITYRDRRVSARGSWGGYSTWRGAPVRRDILVIRDNRYGGGYFRARRIYCTPRYVGRLVYVRPVRYFIAADACIGGVSIRARIVRPHYLYGCNFCDARFDTYGAYYSHVGHCDHRPSGLTISVSNWDDGYDSSWDGPYRASDDYDYEYDRGYDRNYDYEDDYYDD